MMSSLYLSDEEVRERNRLNYRDFRDALKYGSFASEFGWDQRQVDRNDASYLSSMNSYIAAKGQATGAYSDTERAALAKENDAEDETTRDKPLSEIRKIHWEYSDMTDDELKRHIKRGERKPLEERYANF